MLLRRKAFQDNVSISSFCAFKDKILTCFSFLTQNVPSEMRNPRLLRITRKLPRSSLARIPLRLSLKGEVFTFTLNAHPAIDGFPPTHPKGHGATSCVALVEPQRLWALRKQFSVFRDVTLGADGTVILCTESGHVYVRQRLEKGWSFKFSKVPGLQRVLCVRGN